MLVQSSMAIHLVGMVKTAKNSGDGILALIEYARVVQMSRDSEFSFENWHARLVGKCRVQELELLQLSYPGIPDGHLETVSQCLEQLEDGDLGGKEFRAAADAMYQTQSALHSQMHSSLPDRLLQFDHPLHRRAHVLRTLPKFCAIPIEEYGEYFLACLRMTDRQQVSELVQILEYAYDLTASGQFGFESVPGTNKLRIIGG